MLSRSKADTQQLQDKVPARLNNLDPTHDERAKTTAYRVMDEDLDPQKPCIFRAHCQGCPQKHRVLGLMQSSIACELMDVWSVRIGL